ncbi:sugar ABC transporter substrate-binding protein [Halobacteriovorax sp. GB3]|uniref:sugar ABC transporter substrate-binding protein n=1 Tax=Halobacteriovorax sp. GB3 TaxID=2719615 RepID=UPI003FCE6962
MRNLVIILASLFSITALSKEFNIGVLYWSMNIEGQVAMRKGLEAQAKAFNENAALNKKLPRVRLIPYVAGDGEGGVENQIKQMNILIEREDIDLIIVQPTDNAALGKSLLKANAKDIPVIAYDQYIVEGKLTSYVTSNNYQAGYLDGEYIGSLYPNDYEIQLILVEYPKVSSTVERVDGFIDALRKDKQKFKVLKSYHAVEPVLGKAAGQSILKDFPQKGSVDVVFTINDGGGLSVVSELLKAGRNEIKVATIDGDPKSVENIKKGNLTLIDSAQFCGEIGRHSMRLAYEVLLGKEVPKRVLIPTFPITKETLDKYHGWLGEVPNSFKMPWKRSKTWNNEYKEFR